MKITPIALILVSSILLAQSSFGTSAEPGSIQSLVDFSVFSNTVGLTETQRGAFSWLGPEHRMVIRRVSETEIPSEVTLDVMFDYRMMAVSGHVSKNGTLTFNVPLGGEGGINPCTGQHFEVLSYELGFKLERSIVSVAAISYRSSDLCSMTPQAIGVALPSCSPYLDSSCR